MAAAFNDESDSEAYLDDPEIGAGEESFDKYSNEINEYLLPLL